ncbi:anti-sigma factor family protein [Pseudochelatococcus sp. B33]
MTILADSVVEADLQGYLDGQLPLRRRIVVEAHLAARPELAARVMQDMRLRDELVLALTEIPAAPRPATAQAARRLARALRWRRRSETFRRMAAIGLFLAIGWFAHAQFGALGVSEVAASGLPPAYVEEAIAGFDGREPAARDASGDKTYDPGRILAETAIVLPALPDDWRVEDVAIAPSAYGPGVRLSIGTPDLGPVSLIALRPGVFDVVPVTVAHKDAFAIAHWQIGDVAYALVAREGGGGGDAREIDHAADRLIRTLY